MKPGHQRHVETLAAGNVKLLPFFFVIERQCLRPQLVIGDKLVSKQFIKLEGLVKALDNSVCGSFRLSQLGIGIAGCLRRIGRDRYRRAEYHCYHHDRRGHAATRIRNRNSH